MLQENNPNPSQNDASASETDSLARCQRLPLKTADHVRSELARIYRDGKWGRRDVAEVSRLANVLQIMARLIETSDIEARIEKLENSNQS